MKWILAIVIIVVLVVLAWWSGIFGGSSAAPATQAQQGAAAATAVPTTQPTDPTLTDASLDANVATIDTQLGTISAALANPGTSPSAAQVVQWAGAEASASGLMVKLGAKLQVRAGNAKITTQQRVFMDLSSQLSNASSQAGSALKNGGGTTSTSAARQQALKGLMAAQTALVAARADVATLVSAIGIK